MYLCTMIFYFSGTGNTRWAATLLAERLNEQLIYIPEVIREDCRFHLEDDERIGFVFPIHGWRPPLIIRKFIDKLEIDHKDNYCYMLCTAGDSIGRATEIFAKDLKKKGLTLDAAFSLIMPESYVGLPFFDVDPIEKELQKKQKAEKDLEEFATDIENNRKGVIKTLKGPLPAFFSGPVGGYFVKHLITDKPFHVVSEKCVKCGICADVCPVNDIIGGLGEEPKWKHEGDCLSCFTCYHHCPHHAIEYGGRTKHKGQYFFNRKHK
jgi:NAD-dependent dihydropyrimidine dehydrogenase PreA subunit/flavodoxin